MDGGVFMDSKWSLKELYDSFTCEKFQNDMNSLDCHIEKLNKLADEVCESHDREKEKLENYIEELQSFSSYIEKLMSFVNLTISVESKNTKALKCSDILDQKLSLLSVFNTRMNKWISEIENIDLIINESQLLKEHEFFIKEIVRKSSHILSENEESIIAQMKNNGSTAWSKYKDLLISNHKVEIEVNGELKKLPLTVVLNMAYSNSKEERKKAYDAEIESYKSIEDGVAAALNAIKGEVITVCKLRGYDSPLNMTLENSRMDRESLEAMLSAMKESLPVFRKYLRRKAELLGYKNGLPFYELYAPVVEANMEYSYEDGKAFVEKNFRSFSDHLGDFAKRACDNSWIDVYPREGKVGGAFCAGLHSLGESRVMLNYGNNLGDAITMAHELGHGFHGECLKNESILNADYPMPIAETASTFCETIVKKAAIKEATHDEAFAILENEICDCTQVIVDIYSRFLFESELFERRKESSLTAEELKEVMLKAQREAYGDGLDENYLHPYMWTWKPHYYDADFNFYNFPYAFGLLFAKGLYAEYLKRGDKFPNQYEELLSVTGKNMIADVTKIMGIDIHDINFWRGSLKTIEEDINTFLNLSYER